MRRTPPLALVLVATALVGCGSSSATSGSTPTGSGPLDVTVGFYPYAFVAERVGGDAVSVTNLTAPGAEPHDLELSPQQVARLGEADLVIYARGFQPAVDEAVEQQAADRALDVLAEVDLLEGEQHGEVDGDVHAEGQGDPHVWLDPTRLATIADAVADALAERAPEHAEELQLRARELTAELQALDAEMRAGLASCPRTEIVTSHDAFGYLAATYGLEQVPLAGLSPEDEASPKRLAEVATFAQRRGVTTIFFEELVSPKVAESLAREVGAEAKVLSPLEGPPVTGDYLSAMRTNLQSLRTALGCA